MKRIDLITLYIFFSYFRPRYVNVGNIFVRIIINIDFFSFALSRSISLVGERERKLLKDIVKLAKTPVKSRIVPPGATTVAYIRLLISVWLSNQ